MRLTMEQRKAVIRASADRYHKAGKKGKGAILDELVTLTGYNRWYAVGLLNNHGRTIRVGKVRFAGGLRKKGKRKARAPRYGPEVQEKLKQIWVILDYICGKRLVSILPEVIPVLERYGEIALDVGTREKLLVMSAATADRLLSAERKKHELRGRSGTRPGTLLKHQIPIRTFTQWDKESPGFMEIDLVGHDGGDSSGDFCQTLDATDVASGWTETRALPNKAQVWVFEALKEIRGRLPFDLLGIDSDGGAEFINNNLYRYCLAEKITFTRGRAGKKNDGCFVEQKNYSVVRRAVGYFRYDRPVQLRYLNELYRWLRLYTNYFQPVMKLQSKERTGSKVRKVYDSPKTPCQRLQESKELNADQKGCLRKEYETLNPAQLKREITRLQGALMRSVTNRIKKMHSGRMQPDSRPHFPV
jgi:hypothetical protein